MKGWQAIKLKDCSEIFPGYAFDSASFTENETDIPLVKGENLHQGYIDWVASRRWPGHDWSKLAKFQLRANDIVLAMDRPWIEAGLKWSWMKPGYPKALLVQRVARIRANKDVDQTFLRYIIGSGMFEGYVKPIVTGVNVPHISGGQIGNFMCLLPPLPIQRKIAAVLSSYDDLIENNNRRIAILEKMAEELYREWFVRLRFPGHEKAKIVKGVPEGWEVKRIGEIVEHQIGGGWGQDVPTGSENVPVYIIRGTDFKNIEKGSFLSTPLRYEKQSSVNSRKLVHGDLVLENSVNAQSRCTGNTILITKEILSQFDHPVIPASFCKLIRFNDIELSFYIWKEMKMFYNQGLMEYFQNVATNGIANFQMTRFLERFDIKIPSNKQLYLSLWNYDTSFYTLMIANLKQSRDRLLSRLMSGRIDVEHLDIRFPASMKEEEAVNA